MPKDKKSKQPNLHPKSDSDESGNESDNEHSDTEAADQGDTGLEDLLGQLALANGGVLPAGLEEAIKQEMRDNGGVVPPIQQLKLSITNMSSASSSSSATRPVFHFYQLSSQNAVSQEILIQQQVSRRFFRLSHGKKMKDKAKSKEIYDQLVKLPTVNEQHILSPQDYGKYSGSQQSEVKKLLPNKINLDGYSARSVIIGLGKFLIKNGFLPTAIYTIGDSHILCISNNTSNLIGNVNLQAIDSMGQIVRLPFVYGDGNGETKNSLYAKLKSITDAHKQIDIHESMQQQSNKIGSCKNHFIDQLFFLRSIIEVVRYMHPQSPLSEYPIASAQARTSQLLIDKKIELHQAYGLDETEQFYKKNKMIYNESEQSLHRAPYGAVTGKSIASNAQEVRKKIERINARFNEKNYSDLLDVPSSTTLVEGYKFHKQRLVEQYGSGGESSHDDYSDDDKNVQPKAKIKL